MVLFTASHAGPEFNSCTGLLRTARWLLGDEGSAPAIRRRGITLICPCLNPDGYEVGETNPAGAWGNQIGGNPCACYTWEGVSDPDHNPEGVALVRLMDEYCPDVYVDVHGVRYREQAMWDTTGWSWGGGTLARPYCRRLVEEMDAAADAAGFFPIAPEESSGRLRATAPIPGAQDHFYGSSIGTPNVVLATHRYHSLAFFIESGYEESTLARLRRCLELGGERWRGEAYPGYPTCQVGGWCSMTVAAWGETASERRASRVELWGMANRLAFGCGHPEPAHGRMMALCATTPAGIARYLAPGGAPSFDGAGPHLDAVLERLRANPRFDAGAIADWVADSPCSHAAIHYPEEPAAFGAPPRNGLALRLHLPYADAQIQEVRLDGHPVGLSSREGYQCWGEPGTTVQVNLPPGKVEEFHVVTCRYETQTERRPGFTAADWALG